MTEPKAGWLSDSQQVVWRSYLLANTRIADYLDTEMRRFGLSLAEYELLVRLSEAPNNTVRMGELAASVGHSRSRLTHTVKRMEQAGYIRREACDSDGRGVQAVITEAGFRLLREAAPDHVEVVRRVFVDAIHPADYEALGRAMQAVLEATTPGHTSGTLRR